MDELRGQAAPSRASQGRGPESPRGALPSGPVPPSGPGVGPGRRPGERGGLLPEGAGGPGAERPQCRGGAAGPLGTALTPRPSGSPLESVFAIAYRRCRGTDRARTNMSDSDLCEGYQITKQNCAWMAGGARASRCARRRGTSARHALEWGREAGDAADCCPALAASPRQAEDALYDMIDEGSEPGTPHYNAVVLSCAPQISGADLATAAAPARGHAVSRRQAAWSRLHRDVVACVWPSSPPLSSAQAL